jgi:hypothetical protein
MLVLVCVCAVNRYDGTRDADFGGAAMSVPPAGSRAARKELDAKKDAASKPKCVKGIVDIASSHASNVKTMLGAAPSAELLAQHEAVLLANLPLVVGKLLALVETS